MSNENLEIKYFQIGDCPVIITGRDTNDVKDYIIKNKWPKEFLKDIENGKCEEVDPRYVWRCM
ncbi:hypothetical protein BGI40_01665 [Snodgrassella communis]|jgi:hypothetical protein|uniref:hypothetical protein n=1 Tax=Snodgrassella communis TaxID=2946699 RepID=UPI00055F48F1|nr:hypothetical protein [Snodgrassella communis]PIT10694.1 hypothetical protein BGI29_01635 [Snodgrassella communis]PIT30362.1 hypothetical protein BGI39_00715 [Snodgrassella communis]PIT30488.1 hypothetical protein BGI38_00770 [Snodgrassella communis]PIT37117.1 hypothetical protein BGI40_01665 [Snodgrassella communis]